VPDVPPKAGRPPEGQLDPEVPPQTVRAFIALDLDPPSLRATRAIAHRLDAHARRPKAARLIADSLHHLTIKFFASIDPVVALRLIDLIRPFVALAPSPRARISDVTAFPCESDAHIVVIELEPAPFVALAEEIESRAESLGILREERALRPHVTIARTRRAVDARAWLEGAATDEEIAFRELALYRSELSSNGPRYTALGRAQFSSRP
jgi:2'-5' RNA ligase